MARKQQRQAVVDNLDRIKGLLPKGYRRAPKGWFEIDPVDSDGVRHIEGICRVRTAVGDKEEIAQTPDFPLDWIAF